MDTQSRQGVALQARKEDCSRQSTEYSLIGQKYFFNHSDQREIDKAIANNHGLLPYLSMSLANWLMCLLDPSNENVRRLLYLDSRTSDFAPPHLLTST